MENFLSADFNLLEEKAELLKAIAYPVRLCILRGLSLRGEVQVSDMQHCLDIPQSTISQHVGILKDKGLIKGRREGVNIYYSITDKKIKKLIQNILEEK
ncbi:ArsR/SmtB family transcription factor [Treponema phagedenis]|uniref:ArsR/SmtB family transcription factor n=1 Tax=Treponema phagedenis TaxID=162 RepID=UPI0001F63A47|nr:metalloregulator ArsR/SmtB family transcription factor [Treponema phagedenis]EFW39087.1 transcriptional regulator, ArsR family [Treponema phagedenis F0421]TYT78788.1 winged helix-turn-helix transcriptional regulator [Treponema phagedenis]